ncbi:MAG: hypothetical protein ACRDR6_10660 [Pseudonocardiaceae bacterium]
MTRNLAKVAAFIRIVASIILALALVVLGSPAIAGQSEQGPCGVQRAALYQVQQQISVHNAEPHVFVVPEELVAAELYDVEAAQLDSAQSQAVSSLQTCEETLEVLADEGPNSLPLKTQASEKLRDALDSAKAKIPSGWKPSTDPASSGRWEVPRSSPARAVYDLLRKDTPGKSFGEPDLQGKPRPQVGDPDPAYLGKSILGRRSDPTNPAVTADHIVPIAELVNLPGFMELSADNMYMVSRAPINYQWLSWKANLAKSSRDVDEMTGIDPAWQADQVALQSSVRAQMEKVIQQLIVSQH